MRIATLQISAVLLLSSPLDALAEQFLCTEEKATELRLKDLETIEFDVSVHKYLVEEIPETKDVLGRTYNYKAKRRGIDEYNCVRSKVTGEADKIECGDRGKGMSIDLTTLQYKESRGLGLNTGTCTRLK